jgi:hypothetical protein
MSTFELNAQIAISATLLTMGIMLWGLILWHIFN